MLLTVASPMSLRHERPDAHLEGTIGEGVGHPEPRADVAERRLVDARCGQEVPTDVAEPLLADLAQQLVAIAPDRGCQPNTPPIDSRPLPKMPGIPSTHAPERQFVHVEQRRQAGRAARWIVGLTALHVGHRAIQVGGDGGVDRNAEARPIGGAGGGGGGQTNTATAAELAMNDAVFILA